MYLYVQTHWILLHMHLYFITYQINHIAIYMLDFYFRHGCALEKTDRWSGKNKWGKWYFFLMTLTFSAQYWYLVIWWFLSLYRSRGVNIMLKGPAHWLNRMKRWCLRLCWGKRNLRWWTREKSKELDSITQHSPYHCSIKELQSVWKCGIRG